MPQAAEKKLALEVPDECKEEKSREKTKDSYKPAEWACALGIQESQSHDIFVVSSRREPHLATKTTVESMKQQAQSPKLDPVSNTSEWCSADYPRWKAEVWE